MRSVTFAGSVRNTPYTIQGVYGELPYWPGSLTVVAAAPGAGKTSWMLRAMAEAAADGFPAAFACYEHTPDELDYRLRKQAEAIVAGAHAPADETAVQHTLAKWRGAVLMELDDRTDTVNILEHTLIKNLRFPEKSFALVVVDYLQRVPVANITGWGYEQTRAGEAAAALRAMARRHSWAVVAISAAKSETFYQKQGGMDALLGDERIAYEADRVIWASVDATHACGCTKWYIEVLKDRTAPKRSFSMFFYAERFYPSIQPCEGKT